MGMLVLIAAACPNAYALRAVMAPQSPDGGVVTWESVDVFMVLGRGKRETDSRLALAPVLPVISWSVEKASSAAGLANTEPVPPPPVFQRATISVQSPKGVTRIPEAPAAEAKEDIANKDSKETKEMK